MYKIPKEHVNASQDSTIICCHKCSLEEYFRSEPEILKLCRYDNYQRDIWQYECEVKRLYANF